MSTTLPVPEVDMSTSVPLLDKHQNPSITSDQINDAIAEFRLQFADIPQLAQISDDQLQANVSAFLANDQVFTPEFRPSTLAPETGVPKDSCAFAIGVVAVDCVFLVLSFVGLRPVNPSALQEAAAQDMYQIVYRDLNGFQQLMVDLAAAQNPQDKAIAIFKIFVAVYKAGGLRGIVATIINSMTWADWAITGVVAVAQITALLATDGLAFVAKLVMAGASLAYVVSDSVKAVNRCNS